MREFKMKVKGLNTPVPIQQAETIAEAIASKQFADEATILKAAHRARRISTSDTARVMASKGESVTAIAAFVNGFTEGATKRAAAGTGRKRPSAKELAAGQEAVAQAVDFNKLPTAALAAMLAANMIPAAIVAKLREAGKLPNAEPVAAPTAEAPKVKTTK